MSRKIMKLVDFFQIKEKNNTLYFIFMKKQNE